MLQSLGLALTSGCLAAALVLASWPPIALPPSQSTESVRAFNARALGSPGVRRVRLELQSDGVTTRTFEIVHAWDETRDGVSSIVLLDAPENLRGTSYLWFEEERRPNGLAIFLRLPAGQRRVLQIEPSRFDEGLLGSDFSYVDLLWRIPVAGRQLQAAGDTRIDGVAAGAIVSRPASPGARATSPWASIEYDFARDSHMLIGASYYRADAGEGAKTPAKTLRVAGWAAHDGVWSPSSMVMSAPGGQRSVLTLLSITPRTTRLRPDLFDTAALASIAARLEDGAPAASLLERDR